MIGDVHAIISLEVVDELDPIKVWTYLFLLKVCKPKQIFLTPVHRGAMRSTEKHTLDVSREIYSSSQRPSTSEIAAPHSHSG
jgi:hypothetical protein